MLNQLSKIGVAVFFTLSMLLSVSFASYAPEVKAAYSSTVLQFQKDLNVLLPLGPTSLLAEDGYWGPETARYKCAWARLMQYDSKVNHAYPTTWQFNKVRKMVNNGSSVKVPIDQANEYVFVDKVCQMAYVAYENSAGDIRWKRVMPVSTGKAGYETPSGYNWSVLWNWAGMHESSEYPGSEMWWSVYFSNTAGIAFHGCEFDSCVKPYPASHGCVRLNRKDAKWFHNRFYNSNPLFDTATFKIKVSNDEYTGN